MDNKPTLIYRGTHCLTKEIGDPVEVGDIVTNIHNRPPGENYEVIYFREPSSPASSGKVTIRRPGTDHGHECYVGVIGAEWINRTDR